MCETVNVTQVPRHSSRLQTKVTANSNAALKELHVGSEDKSKAVLMKKVSDVKRLFIFFSLGVLEPDAQTL